jgi:hypothetical protein
MKHYDYEWDLESWGIKFDPELNIDKLGWQAGDCFKIKNVNGRAMLIKLDPVEQFVKRQKVNCDE